MNPNAAIKLRLEGLFRLRGLTKKQAADACSISPSHITMITQGKCSLSPSIIERLKKGLDLSDLDAACLADLAVEAHGYITTDALNQKESKN